jgi:DNA-binding PucR family transcriptional regulator
VSTYNSNKEKAAKILNLSVLEATEESIKDILKGMKTVSFFENIFRPHTSEAVTVDLWQIRWAKLLNILPKQGTLTPKRYNKVAATKRYNKVAARVRKYAKKLDIMPHQFQAVTWVALRGRAW